MGSFSPWHGFFLLMMVAIPAAMVMALVWWVRRGRRDPASARERIPERNMRAPDAPPPPVPVAVGSDAYERPHVTPRVS